MLFNIKSIKWGNLNNSTKRTRNYTGHVSKRSVPQNIKIPFLVLVHENMVLFLEPLSYVNSEFFPTYY